MIQNPHCPVAHQRAEEQRREDERLVQTPGAIGEMMLKKQQETLKQIELANMLNKHT